MIRLRLGWLKARCRYSPSCSRVQPSRRSSRSRRASSLLQSSGSAGGSAAAGGGAAGVVVAGPARGGLLVAALRTGADGSLGPWPLAGASAVGGVTGADTGGCAGGCADRFKGGSAGGLVSAGIGVLEADSSSRGPSRLSNRSRARCSASSALAASPRALPRGVLPRSALTSTTRLPDSAWTRRTWNWIGWNTCSDPAFLGSIHCPARDSRFQPPGSRMVRRADPSPPAWSRRGPYPHQRCPWKRRRCLP